MQQHEDYLRRVGNRMVEYGRETTLGNGLRSRRMSPRNEEYKYKHSAIREFRYGR